MEAECELSPSWSEDKLDKMQVRLLSDSAPTWPSYVCLFCATKIYYDSNDVWPTHMYVRVLMHLVGLKQIDDKIL